MINFNLYLKILLKFIRYEFGIKAFLYLIIFSLYFGVARKTEYLVLSVLAPSAIIFAVIFEFKKHYKNFLIQFFYLPNSYFYLKGFSIFIGFISLLYFFIILFMFQDLKALELLSKIYGILFFVYFVVQYIFLRIYLILSFAFFTYLCSILLPLEISLSLNMGVALISASIIKELPHSVLPRAKYYFFNKNYIKKISKSNYVIWFLKQTIRRNKKHRSTYKVLIILILVLELIILILTYKNGSPEFVYVFSFFLPIILLAILTYTIILCKKLDYEIINIDIFEDAYLQLSSLYFKINYSILAVLIFPLIFILRKEMLEPEMFYFFCSFAFYSHYSYYYIFYTPNYIYNFLTVIVFSIITLNLPLQFNLLFSLSLFIILRVLIHNKRKRLYAKN